MKFCSTACHEMTWVHEEYLDRPHYQNATGVGATCSDCHVPDDWGPKMIRKIEASREVWHWMLGTINTKEKFEDKRLHLAENVWRSMLRTDSRECRNCHDWSAMDLEEQAPVRPVSTPAPSSRAKLASSATRASPTSCRKTGTSPRCGPHALRMIPMPTSTAVSQKCRWKPKIWVRPWWPRAISPRPWTGTTFRRWT